ncbi:MAG: gamma-glutamylcyclotransferase [Deltaproteobacteria bacterium]|nr:MAG: gamma-glutamylcyclotransferase [Deltaproteobacteria bacterium]
MVTFDDEQLGNVFVYGSLKRGEFLYFLEPLMDMRVEVLPAKVEAVVLYDLGEFPGVVIRADGKMVWGEVHRFRSMETVLEILDEVEQYYGERDPENLYRRVDYKAELLDGGGHVSCWLYEYVGPLDEACLIKSGVWLGAEVQHNKRD